MSGNVCTSNILRTIFTHANLTATQRSKLRSKAGIVNIWDSTKKCKNKSRCKQNGQHMDFWQNRRHRKAKIFA